MCIFWKITEVCFYTRLFVDVFFISIIEYQIYLPLPKYLCIMFLSMNNFRRFFIAYFVISEHNSLE